MGLTDAGENLMLNWMAGRAALPSGATAYVGATLPFQTMTTPFHTNQGCLGLYKVTPTDLGELTDEVAAARSANYDRLSLSVFGAGFPASANGMNANTADIVFMATPPSALGTVNAIQAFICISNVWVPVWNSQLQGVAQCLAGVPIIIPKGAISARMASGSILARPTINQILDWALKGTTQAQITVKLGLMVSPPNADGTGGVEVNGGVSGTNGYARPTASTYFTSAAAQGQISNVTEVPFGTPTASWGDASYLCGFNNTGTTAIWTLPIPTKTCYNSGPIKVPAGALTLTGD